MTYAVTQERTESADATSNGKRQINWTYVAAGLALGGYGLARRSLLGMLGAGATAYLAYKGIQPRQLGQNVVDATKMVEQKFTRVVTIGRSINDVYELLADISLWPSFCTCLDAVERYEVDKLKLSTHFGGVMVPLCAELTNVQNRSIAFELKNGDFKLADIELKLSDGRGGTILSGTVTYMCLLGKVGRMVSKPFITNELDTFIMRLRQLAETGEIAKNVPHDGAATWKSA